MALGIVWLVGAGPGDPGLITVRGAELLGRADVVLHDALSHPALLELCPQAELRNVGKRFGVPSPRQEEITEQLIELARAGLRVVRLKGGDPLMFARGAEEALALATAGIPFEIVPGISSPVATSAYAGIALTHRGLSTNVTFITGSEREGKEWSPEAMRKLATATDTVCILMGMWRLGELASALIDGGRPPETPAAVIQWGARPEQRVVTDRLDRIAEAVARSGLSNPAVIVVGQVVRLREQLAWYDRRPLFGKRILVPRPAHQARETAREIRERAAEPVLCPAIEIVDPPLPALLSKAAAELSTYDWVLFTSANGVERLFAELERQALDARAFGAAKLGVIGPKTAAALRRFGVRADVVAKQYVGEGLAQSLLEQRELGKVLIVRALEARDALPQALKARGAVVDVVPAYETRPASADKARAFEKELESGNLDAVLFTSSSTVTSVCGVLGARAAELLARTAIASIGPITSQTLRDRGLEPTVTAEVYTVSGLLDALERHFDAASANSAALTGKSESP